MTELPRALLVDLDDTVLSYSSPAESAWREVCQSPAAALCLEADALLQAVRAAARAFWSDPVTSEWGRLDMEGARRHVTRGALASLGVADDARADALAGAFSELRERAVAPFPGALEALATLRARGVRLALVTNGAARSQRGKLERFGLEDRFDSIHIEEEVGAGKPDPRIFRAALEAQKTNADAAWMIGDNLARDVAGAQGVGVHAIWCDWRGEGLPADAPAEPDRIVRALADLVGS